MGTPPRVLVLSAYYFPFQGGTETHARLAATSLRDAGFDVRIVTRQDDRRSPANDRVDGIPVHRVPPGGARTGLRKWAMLPFAFAAIVRRRREFDLLYCPGYQGIGLAALAAGALLHRPVVLRSGNLGVLSGRQWDAPLARWHIPAGAWPIRWAKRLVQRCYLGADAMICNCRANEEEALACGMPADRLHYVPNAVDPDRFRPARTDESSDIRRAEGWPVTARICVYVGRLSREKGVLDLLEAWRSMHRSGDLLVLVGPDMPGPLDAGPAARQFVADHGLAASVRFHGESTDTARLLRAADVYVQPSHYESFSNALIEAMATGLPLAASRVGGMLDCVVDGENGRLFAPGDASDLARVLGPLMRDPIAAARLGVRARETVLARFQQTVIARDLAAIFTATAARYSTAAARAERTSGGPGRAA